MISLAAAREKAGKVFERRYPSWAVDAADSSLSIPLGPPTDKQALSAPSQVAQWIAQWDQIDGVVWEQRRWANSGTQLVPVRLVLDDAEAIAKFIKNDRAWAEAKRRAARLLALEAVDRGCLVAGVIKSLKRSLGLDPADFERLFDVLAWLIENPGSGLFARQIPVPGVDSKWFERNATLVKQLHLASAGVEDTGLATVPKQYRVKFLDAALAPGGLIELSAPLSQLARLAMAPEVVLVVENIQSLLALPAMEGVVAVHGAGYDVTWLTSLPWTEDASLLYWGDLDVDGLAILSRLRAHRPDAVSVMMDASTYLAHRGFAVNDPNAPGSLPDNLSQLESEVWDLLASERGRLEQERLPWADALWAIESAVRDLSAVRV